MKNVFLKKLPNKQQEHPSHNSKPSYLPFLFIGLICFGIGGVGAIFIKLFWPKLKSFVINSMSSVIVYDDWSVFNSTFGQGWLNSADDTLIYLTTTASPSIRILFSDIPFYYDLCVSGMIFLFFTLLLKWLFILMLPFVVKNFKQWFIWFTFLSIILIGWVTFMHNANLGFFSPWTPDPITFTWDGLYVMLNYRWTDDQYSKVGVLLLQWHHKLYGSLIFFGFVSLLVQGEWLKSLVERFQFFKKVCLRLQAQLLMRPKMLLVNMVVSSIFGPILLENVISGMPLIFYSILLFFTWLIAQIIGVSFPFKSFVSLLLSSNFVQFCKNLASRAHDAVYQYPITSKIIGGTATILGFHGSSIAIDHMRGTGTTVPPAAPQPLSPAVGGTTILPPGSVVVFPPGTELFRTPDGTVVAKTPTNPVNPTITDKPAGSTTLKHQIVPNQYTKYGVNKKST